MLQIPLAPEDFPRTWNVLREGVETDVAPGFVVGVWRATAPNQYGVAAHGQRRKEPSPQPMLPETIFDLASITKVFSTAPLVATLVDRGWLQWNTPLHAILPDFPLREVSLTHLLAHTSGLPAWQPLFDFMRGEFGEQVWKAPISERQRKMRERVVQVGLERPCGERAVYSDLSFLLLGFALEEVTGMALDQAVQRFLWNPMGIGGAFYRRVDQSVDAGRLESVAATEACPWRKGVLQGQVHDDNCWSMGGYAGHAGAFGDISQLMKFVKAISEGFFSREVLHAMWTRVERPLGCERTLGWDTPSGEGSSAGRYFSTKTVGHLGFTGTSLWIDIEAGLAVSLLSNRVHPSRENWKIKAFRPKFHDALREDLRHH